MKHRDLNWTKLKGDNTDIHVCKWFIKYLECFDSDVKTNYYTKNNQTCYDINYSDMLFLSWQSVTIDEMCG